MSNTEKYKRVSDSNAMSIAIDSRWGTGKTTFVEMWKDLLEEQKDEEEKIIEEENTVEVAASIDDNSSSTSSSDFDSVLGLATLGAMVGIPVYLHKKKKSK